MFKAIRQTMKNVNNIANTKVLANNLLPRSGKVWNKMGQYGKSFGNRFMMKTTGSQYAAARDDILRSGSNKMGKMYNAVRPIVKPVSYAGMFALGATAMTGVAVMNGAMSAASDSMATRYMKDSRYSSKVLQNRVGRSHGNGSLSIGNHAGLSLAMSKARHG